MSRLYLPKIWAKHVDPPHPGWMDFTRCFKATDLNLVWLAGFREQTERPNSFDPKKNCKTWKESIFVSIGWF